MASPAKRHKHQLPTSSVMSFKKLLVSISGGVKRRKEELARTITEKGGEYTGEMTKLCTHLVVLDKLIDSRQASQKELHARQWRMPVVTAAWVEAVAKMEVFEPVESRYLVPEPRRIARLSQPDATRTTSTDKAAAIPVEAARPLADPSPSKLDSRSGQTEPAVPPDTADRSVPPPVVQESGELGQARPRPPLQPAKNPGEAEPRETTADQGEDDDCCGVPDFWLSRVRVHLIGLSAPELECAREICNKGAATKLLSIKDHVTHIIAGSELTTAEAEAVRSHLRETDFCVLTSPAWLEECFTHKHMRPVGKHAITPAALVAQATSRQQNAVSAGKQPRRRPPLEQLLLGKWFTLAALSDTEDAHYFHGKIQGRGGRIFDARSCSFVPDWGDAYAICPSNMSPAEIKELQARSLDFAKVPEQNRLSMRWLDMCEDAKELLLPVPPECIECKPLRLTKPKELLKHVWLTTSNLDEIEDNRVRLLVRIMGGRSTASLEKHTTHLVVQHTAGPKYEEALQRNIAIVTLDWVLDVARTGKLRAERHYQPPSPPRDKAFVDSPQHVAKSNAKPATSGCHRDPMAARAASKRPRIPEESGNRDAVAPDQEQPTKRSRLELIEEEVDKTARANSSRLEKGPTKALQKAAGSVRGQLRPGKRPLLGKSEDTTRLSRRAETPRVNQSSAADAERPPLQPAVPPEGGSPSVPADGFEDDSIDPALTDQVERCEQMLLLMPQPNRATSEEPVRMPPPPPRGGRKARTVQEVNAEPQLDLSQQVSYQDLAVDPRVDRQVANGKALRDTAAIKMRLATLAGLDEA